MCRILTRIRRSIMIVSRRLILCCLFLLTVATQPAHALIPTRRSPSMAIPPGGSRTVFWAPSQRRLRRPRMVTSGSELSRGWCASMACALFRGRRQRQAVAVSRRLILLAARDGSLWIGTVAGLSHWVNDNLINYQIGLGLDPLPSSKIATAQSGSRVHAWNEARSALPGRRDRYAVLRGGGWNPDIRRADHWSKTRWEISGRAVSTKLVREARPHSVPTPRVD